MRQNKYRKDVTRRLESKLRAAQEKIESLEAELNCVQKRYNRQNRKLKTHLSVLT
jgi:chromosome segregation ATPase